MDLPGQVKIFLWRFSQNSLPTRKKIQRKGIELDTRCPVSIGLTWTAATFPSNASSSSKYGDNSIWRLSDYNSWIARMLPKLQAKVAVTLWDWWTSRNKVNAGETRNTAGEICHVINKHHQVFIPEDKPANLVQQPVSS